MKSNQGLWISILITVLLVIGLAFLVDWSMVIHEITQADWRLLVLGSIFMIIGFMAYAIRWRLLLDNKPGFMNTFHAANVANMVNTLLPLRPGDAARILMLRGPGSPPVVEITSSVVVERWFEQIMRLAAFGGAIVFGAGMVISRTTILGSVAFLVGVFVFMIWMINKQEYVLLKFPVWIARLPRISEDRARKELTNLIDGLERMSSFRRLAWALVWSLITWSLFWAFHYLSLMAMDQQIDINTALALSLGSLALVPPSATTLPGIYQLSMVVPLSLVGYDKSLLTAYAVLMNFVEMGWIMLLGIWGLAGTGLSFHQVMSQSKGETETAGESHS